MTAEVKGIKSVEADGPVSAAIQDAVKEKVHDFEHQLEAPLGDPTAEQLEDYAAGWGDFVVMSASGLVASLPLAKRVEAGRIIPIKNTHATADLTVRPAGSDTIDDVNSDVTIPAGACYGYYCQGDGAWLELWRPAAGGGSWELTVVGPKTANYTASFGEMVLCNMSGGWTLTLPSISAGDVGKVVVAKVYSGASTLTVAAGSGQSHTEADGNSMPYNWHSRIYVAISTTEWAIAADYQYALMG